MHSILILLAFMQLVIDMEGYTQLNFLKFVALHINFLQCMELSFWLTLQIHICNSQLLIMSDDHDLWTLWLYSSQGSCRAEWYHIVAQSELSNVWIQMYVRQNLFLLFDLWPFCLGIRLCVKLIVMRFPLYRRLPSLQSHSVICVVIPQLNNLDISPINCDVNTRSQKESSAVTGAAASRLLSHAACRRRFICDRDVRCNAHPWCVVSLQCTVLS